MVNRFYLITVVEMGLAFLKHSRIMFVELVIRADSPSQ